jgi:hypothetical protein
MPLSLGQFGQSFDTVLRTIIIVSILGFVLVNGTVFENHYPSSSVELYNYPLWRFLIVFLVIVGAWWCPYVGLATATAAFFYLGDMHTLTIPFTNSM